MKYRIVLASGSPRRKEILAGIGASYDVIVSDCDESTELTDPAELVKELSGRKAEAVNLLQQIVIRKMKKNLFP